MTGAEAGEAVVLPMFPLGAVLLPTGRLPLHVFEPRYQALTRHCLTGDRRFGVVLIERGSEVGGGDVRTDVGTVAEIDQAITLPAGRFGLLAHGTRRLRVQRWLPDNPFPRAAVCVLPDDPAPPGPETLRTAEAAVRRAYALRSELGAGPAWPADTPLPHDPALAGWMLCDLAPLGPLDRQQLLQADDADHRLALLASLIEAVADDAARLLSSG